MSSESVDKVLSRGARPAWQLILLIVAIALAVLKLIDIDHKYAMAAAQEALTPLHSDFKAHLEETRALRPVMKQMAEDLKKTSETNARNNYRICQKLHIECEQP